MAQPSLSRGVAVLVVDDQPVFLRAARELIAATPGFDAIGEATSGSAALEMASRLHPDVVLLDVRMPVMDGIETARRLAEVVPDAFVVLISLESSADLAAVVPHGVHAHVRKQDLSVRTLPALWAARVAAG
jgi:two-component system, NarL family, invasion response regulator UvrY